MGMSPYMRELRSKVGNQLLAVPAAAVAIRDAEGRLLVGLHASGDVWVVPGGAVEPEERPADAAIREVLEETGLQVALRGIVGVYGGPRCTVEYENGDRTSYLIVGFSGAVVGGELRPDREEFQALRYVGLAELRNLSMAPWLPELLADLEREPYT